MERHLGIEDYDARFIALDDLTIIQAAAKLKP
jgi:hypothetical protein